MFHKILIANRGEIACRIIASAKKLGVATVAVYSDADKNAQHVKLADEAVYIGANPPVQSYLQMDKIISAAKATNANAIHPGYGFLSENADFAKACADNDIVFIGPPVSAILDMGLKATSKALMQNAGVPLTPGYHGDNQDPHFLHAQADQIGYPLLIKASAGGGGKGMRLVEKSEEFLENLSSCKAEAKSSFGNEDVLIERYIVNPRHVEVQIFGDTHGNYVHLFERDCSVQRRHQKVIEEAPAPNISEDKLAIMRKAAIDAARAVNYVGAGTVEFIADQSGTAYFMEMNTRLQVEHPVTEMVTGIDLVEWQLRVAFGEKLPKTQDEIICQGHAIEARIYAEIPEDGYLPAIGKITHLSPPTPSARVRVDSGVVANDDITTFYDPMIAKLIVWGEDRKNALTQMHHALQEFHIAGLGNNVAFLDRIIRLPAFADVALDTGLIGKHEIELLSRDCATDDDIMTAGVIWFLLNLNPSGSAWHDRPLWRSNVVANHVVEFEHMGQTLSVSVRANGDDGFVVNYHEHELTLNVILTSATTAQITQDSIRKQVAFYHDTTHHVGHLTLFSQANAFAFAPKAINYGTNADDNAGGLKAPMPGMVTAVMVQKGQSVKKDDILLTLEAMKITYTIKAPDDGVVQEVFFGVGDQLKADDELIAFEKA
ncbi:3-methylcrotonyl-CoA carboxylase [Moraxella caviae]|uniref:Biotin carboxylase n=1 Tax=Moraxella caviae TaxID=34060 RepID=A0A1T0A844_9GAMM|nr:acetyl/propionyl/methylcrotonyl-CoA carboxylase subunit alpha [Moraxella caviae]OOR91894.1 3-methylcrotonyl-CoA carboxylase [Moraxella caviae]STZ09747.1 Acetyl-/propionyl-coenzyme A carboxylase alpha chain [Moraxella caviae]VEW11214.1 Acetyl-/propionyl-coenzyme A carboxylase alpha chain [Moraxella caviae]